MTDDSSMADGGLYELCIGVPDLTASVDYFKNFGFHVSASVILSAEQANTLYGVNSSAQVTRLAHGNADHGFIRLMEWETPVNSGLGRADMRSIGSRWSNNHTMQIGRLHSHALIAQRQGQNIDICPPGFAEFGGDGSPVEPFKKLMTGVYEFALRTDLYRQCFFERIDYPSPNYGTINPDCLFQTSQVTHCGLVTSTNNHAVFDFYDKCLGLKRILDVYQPYTDIHVLNQIFDIPEGMGVHALAFDDPNAGEGTEKKSGRILIFNFEEDKEIKDLQECSRAGVLGYSHYTWRVRDLRVFREKALSSGAKEIGSIQADEFGTLSWACTAPDGYYWVFMQSEL